MSVKNSILYINSNLDRKPSEPLNSSSWTTVLSHPIKTYSGKIKMKLLEIEAPNTFYTFGPNAYIFWYYNLYTNEYKAVPIPTDRFFVDGEQFVNVMNQICIAGNFAVRFSYNATNAKLTVTNVSNDTIRIVSSYRYEPDNTYDDAMDRLGFTQNMLNNISSTLDTNDYLQAESPLRLIRTNCVYLQCNVIASQNIPTTIVPSPFVTAPDIIARVTSGNFGMLSQLQLANLEEFDVGNNLISELKWTLLDENYNEINTNGHPITFSVLVRFE